MRSVLCFLSKHFSPSQTTRSSTSSPSPCSGPARPGGGPARCDSSRPSPSASLFSESRSTASATIDRRRSEFEFHASQRLSRTILGCEIEDCGPAAHRSDQPVTCRPKMPIGSPGGRQQSGKNAHRVTARGFLESVHLARIAQSPVMQT